MGTPVFKSDAAKARLQRWYDRFMAKIDVQNESKVVETSFGSSHVLAAGDPSKPPMVCLHAMLTSSAHLLSELSLLARDYYLLAPDIPGQSVKGIPTRLSYTDDSHARWLREVVDGLKLSSFDLLGVSLGGFVSRQFATEYPERVKSLTLIVPAGIVQGSLVSGFSKMAWPMMKFRMNQSEKNLRGLLEHLVTTWDDDWSHYIGDSFLDFNPNMKIPPLATDVELSKLTMPVLVVATEHDISFPGEAVIDRLQGKIPNLQTELLKGAKHSPPTTPEFREWLYVLVSKHTERKN